MIIVLVIVGHLLVKDMRLLEELDYKLYDYLSSIDRVKPDTNASSHVVIIDVDEKSLNEFGAWPWSRLIDAGLLAKVNAHKPAVIAFNFLFTQADAYGAKTIQDFYQKTFHQTMDISGIDKNLQDSDKVFANYIKEANASLPVYILNNKDMISNYPLYHENYDRFGFMNIYSDSDGILRRAKLFSYVNNSYIPAFSLDILSSFDKNSTKRSQKMDILGYKFKTDENYQVLIDTSVHINSISALDVMSFDVEREKIEGKIAIIGALSAGMEKDFKIVGDKEISNTQFQAMVVENIMSQTLKYQDNKYKAYVIYLSMLLTVLAIIFIAFRFYILLFMLFVFALLGVLILSYMRLKTGVYISAGYFLVPFSITAFGLTLMFTIISKIDKQKFDKEIYKAQSATLESMSLLVGVYDNETGGHIIRTKKYAQKIASFLYEHRYYRDKISPEFIELIYYTAPMHDIGKVGIPESILKKPAKFTVDEFEVMKKHPTIAKDIIDKIIGSQGINPFLKMSRNIAYSHHEKWNGSGYPQGLSRYEIPLEAQIMGVADMYDALISKRCYKKEFSFEDTEALILQESGVAFDPTVVKAFYHLKDEFKQIALQYKDV